MKSTGSIAKNFHEGTRSEYLAQYVFSAFGTSVPVPHPEDSGIDLYCTLGKKIGHRLHVQNYYFVQVKSNRSPIKYDGADSIEWILSHNYPFIICLINKKESLIEIFQTILLSTCYYKEGIKSITLSFDSWTKPFRQIETEENIKICIGPPILKFKITMLEKKNWFTKSHEIMKTWIELDQENINFKSIGLNLFLVPEEIKTNKMIKKPTSFIGNFKLQENHQNKFHDIFFRLFSQVINQIASEKEIEMFNFTTDFVGLISQKIPTTDSWGIRLLILAVNNGAKYLGISKRMKINKEDGTSEILVSKIN